MSRGLLLVGTSPKSGKTIACSGIAACLSDSGFQVMASKPIMFYEGHHPPLFNEDQRFIDAVTKPLFAQETVVIESPQTFTTSLWKRLIEQLSQAPYPLLIEAPTTLAAPIRYASFQDDANHRKNRSIFDAIDLAETLNLDILLVVPVDQSPYADIAFATTYLNARNHQSNIDSDSQEDNKITEPDYFNQIGQAPKLAGWISVDTSSNSRGISPRWEQDGLMASQDFHIPYLGNIAFSSSISVTLCHPGNLLAQTEAGIDLLPLQQAMEMPIFS